MRLKNKMEIKTKLCPLCGKMIQSIYQTQLEWNYDAHLRSCENKLKEDNQNEKDN